MSLEKILGYVYAKVGGWVVTLIKMLPNLVVALFVLLLFWLLGLVAARLTLQSLLRVSNRPRISNLFSRLAHLAVFALGAILALDILNLEKGVASLLAGIGILGVAFGFASQDIAQNFIAGVLLIFWHPFRPGDLIKSGDFFGFIEAINMRSTSGVSLPGHKVILPNKGVLGAQIQNFTSEGAHRLEISCGVALNSNLLRLEEQALKAVESLELRHPELPVKVFFEEFGSNSVNLTILFWTRGGHEAYVKARSEAIKAIKQTFDENDFTIKK